MSHEFHIAHVKYPENRSLLVDNSAPDAKSYVVRRRNGTHIAMFVTGGVNGKSADDTAVGNLSDLSEYESGPLHLYEAGQAEPLYSNGSCPIAVAFCGCTIMTDNAKTMAAFPNRAAAESFHEAAWFLVNQVWMAESGVRS